jgi:hypothetical protein
MRTAHVTHVCIDSTARSTPPPQRLQLTEGGRVRSFDAEDDPTPLLYTAEAAGSHLLSSLPGYVVETMRDEPITMENHGKGEYCHCSTECEARMAATACIGFQVCSTPVRTRLYMLPKCRTTARRSTNCRPSTSCMHAQSKLATKNRRARPHVLQPDGHCGRRCAALAETAACCWWALQGCR